MSEADLSLSQKLVLSPERRHVLDLAAQWFVPKVPGYPSLTEADPHDAVLELVLRELQPVMTELLAALDDAERDIRSYLAEGQAADSSGFTLLRTLVHGWFFTCRPVWTVLGYPGRRPNPIRVGEAEEYLAGGLLDGVVLRGKIYRPTPGLSGPVTHKGAEIQIR